MPAVLPVSPSSPPVADQLLPLGVAAVWQPDSSGAIRGVEGLPAPFRGSVGYDYIYAWGYLADSGWLTLNRGRKGLRRTGRGIEDGLGTTRT